MRDPAWVGYREIGAILTRLPDTIAPDITPPMPQVAYIAELSAADYPRFRERDPKLPPTHAAWTEATDKRVSAARRAGAKVIRHPIAFAEFEAFLTAVSLTDFGASARDCYAADMREAAKGANRR